MIIAVDPGEERTGIATMLGCGKVVCHTLKPWQAVRYLDHLLWEDVTLVMENWIPYPNQGSNTYRELIEAKCLGALEYMCQTRQVTYAYQPTTILTPTQALADSRGYRWSAIDRDQKSAETHLYYYNHLRG